MQRAKKCGPPARSIMLNQPLFEFESLYAHAAPRKSSNVSTFDDARTTTSAK